ncbi:hypothetical protein QE411_003238 [Microbacterium arborescens]|nr:hypothetical protein [Microbacterium arborescens]
MPTQALHTTKGPGQETGALVRGGQPTRTNS